MAAAPAPVASAMDQLVGQLPKDASRYQVPAKPGDVSSAAGFEAWMQANGVRVATGKPGGAAAPVVPAPVAAPAVPAVAAVPSSPLQLQVASFSSRDNADRALARLAAAGIADARLTDVPGNGGARWRLRVGAPDAATAEALAGRIAGLGFGRPQLVRE